LSGKGRQSLASGNMRFSVAWKPMRQSGCSVAALAALLVLVMRNAPGSYQYEGRRTKVAIDAFTGNGDYMDQDFHMASNTFTN
jgi:hypothetical protein